MSPDEKNKKLKIFLRQSNLIEEVNDVKADLDTWKAYKFLEAFDKLTLSRILEANRIILIRLDPRIAGNLRQVEVRVGYRMCPSFLQVPGLMADWLEDYGDAMSLEEIKEAHIEFERIHPFEDGNGRTGRLIMLWQWLKNGHPIKIIYAKNRQDYYLWFK